MLILNSFGVYGITESDYGVFIGILSLYIKKTLLLCIELEIVNQCNLENAENKQFSIILCRQINLQNNNIFVGYWLTVNIFF